MRQDHKHATLTREQIAALERVRGWAWQVRPTPRRYLFPPLLRLLQQFSQREGHANVPQEHVERGIPLGRCVGHYRRAYKRGRLAEAKRRAFEQVPGWTWQARPTPLKVPFRSMVHLLRAFAKREGHGNVPQDHVERRVRLGQWVAGRRQAYWLGTLREDERRGVETVPGWEWRVKSGPIRLPLEPLIHRLKRFAKREGHPRVPRQHVEDGVPLGRWISSRRDAYARGRLPEPQRRALESVPGWSWSARPTPRRVPDERMFTLLRRFVAHEGHARVPSTLVQRGVPLGKWVANRRIAFRRASLATEWIRRLESLQGWTWDPKEDDFERMLTLLRRYTKREGHARPGREHIEGGRPLGAWVARLRLRHRRGQLDPRQARLVGSLRGWRWTLREPGVLSGAR